ncbi:SLC22A3 (predicted) [Pycnogonum litorale]
MMTSETNMTAKNHTVISLLRTPNMRRKALIMFFCWAVNAFVYYGLSFNTNDLGGDPFINFLISGALEIPAYIMTALIVLYFGRKYPLTFVMVVGGLGCAATIVIPEGKYFKKIYRIQKCSIEALSTG